MLSTCKVKLFLTKKGKQTWPQPTLTFNKYIHMYLRHIFDHKSFVLNGNNSGFAFDLLFNKQLVTT